MKNLQKRLGARIKEIRKAKRWTQEELAEKTDISSQYLSRLELGLQTPSLETLAKLAEVFGIELAELFEFRHTGTLKEIREQLRVLLQEEDEQKLRLALKVFRAVLR